MLKIKSKNIVSLNYIRTFKRNKYTNIKRLKDIKTIKEYNK